MSFVDAIRILNRLKQRRVIRGYVVIGAVVATAYMEPILTEDLDIIVLVDTDEEYIRTFRRVGESADAMEGMHFVLGGVPVQMFPSTTKPLYRDALENARDTRIGGLRVKLASPEHLLVLYLEAFREKDHHRIRTLLPQSRSDHIRRLLEKFDDGDGRLASRLQTLR
jgi:predicted nucleotidyltransferase